MQVERLASDYGMWRIGAIQGPLRAPFRYLLDPGIAPHIDFSHLRKLDCCIGIAAIILPIAGNRLESLVVGIAQLDLLDSEYMLHPFRFAGLTSHG